MILSFWRWLSLFFRFVLSDIGIFLVGIFVGCKVELFLRCSFFFSFLRFLNNDGYCCCRKFLVIGFVMLYCFVINVIKFFLFMVMSFIVWIVEILRIGLSFVFLIIINLMLYFFLFWGLWRVNYFFFFKGLVLFLLYIIKVIFVFVKFLWFLYNCIYNVLGRMLILDL